jgi:signal transduction histidine kinase
MAERLAIVAAEADRLQAIVDGFLTFSRGLDDLRLDATRPHDLARELVLLLETRANDNGVSLVVTGDQALTVHADARKLRQALLNLVLNAMQASPRDKAVTIDIGRACDGRARIKVIDEGVGMSPDVLERIRKPYFTTKEGGSGLGVAVSRGIIEQHGGQLKYDSAPGKGTIVTIELPPDAQPHCAKALPNPARSAAKLPVEAPAR